QGGAHGFPVPFLSEPTRGEAEAHELVCACNNVTIRVVRDDFTSRLAASACRSRCCSRRQPRWRSPPSSLPTPVPSLGFRLRAGSGQVKAFDIVSCHLSFWDSRWYLGANFRPEERMVLFN